MTKAEILKSMLKMGEISRREFLTRMSALGATAVFSPMLLNSPARAMTPKSGDRLRIGLAGGSTSDSLDPAVMTNMAPVILSMQLRNCLVEIDNKSMPIPELAESWDSTPDAKKWIFKLRKGISFHNGKTFDANDVIFSINHHRGDNSKSPMKALLSMVENIKIDDKHTIIFSLKEGYADLPYILSDYRMQIFPDGTKDCNDGIGTGGYVLKEYESGVRAFSTRNPNYWKKGRAHFNEVEMILIEDVTARTTALITGKIDVMNRCDRKTLDLLKKNKDIQIVEVPGTKHYAMPMRVDTAPFNNKDVRLALKYAIDREVLLDKILRGHGSIGNDHPISPINRYFASELPQRKYDPEKALYHLKKADMTEEIFKLHVSDAAYEGAIDTAILFKEHAGRAGVKIDVVREPSDGYWSNVWLKKGWCISYWFGRPVEDITFSIAYTSDAPWNETFWKNDKFDKLFKEARIELDENKRRQLYWEMQKIVHDDGGALIPLFPNDINAATNKLKFDKVSGNLEFDGTRLPERWWFES